MLVPASGALPLPEGPGLGVRLNPERLTRDDVEIRRCPE
jgi:L-alanine-DL-glutamate epimerase-like enolase superfamily enzyme